MLFKERPQALVLGWKFECFAEMSCVFVPTEARFAMLLPAALLFLIAVFYSPETTQAAA